MVGKYTTEQPEEGWEMAAFNDSTWAQGNAAFGTEGGPSVGTPWNTNRLWIRREVSFDPSLVKNRQLFVRYSYNDGMQLLINGKELVRTGTKGTQRRESADSGFYLRNNGRWKSFVCSTLRELGRYFLCRFWAV